MLSMSLPINPRMPLPTPGTIVNVATEHDIQITVRIIIFEILLEAICTVLIIPSRSSIAFRGASRSLHRMADMAGLVHSTCMKTAYSST
jgi:hypothetical protein